MNKFKEGDKVRVNKSSLVTDGQVGFVLFVCEDSPKVEVELRYGAVITYHPDSLQLADSAKEGKDLLGKEVELHEDGPNDEVEAHFHASAYVYWVFSTGDIESIDDPVVNSALKRNSASKLVEWCMTQNHHQDEIDNSGVLTKDQLLSEIDRDIDGDFDDECMMDGYVIGVFGQTPFLIKYTRQKEVIGLEFE